MHSPAAQGLSLNNRTSALGPLVILLLLGALSLWLERAVQVGTDSHGIQRHDPDFWVENFSVRRFGPGGQLQNSFTAARMEHFPDDNTSNVTLPRIKYYRTPPVSVSAQRGLIGKDGKQIDLVGQVQIEQSGHDGSLPLQVQTLQLSAFPDEERALTSSPVTIIQGRTRITGSGFEIDNKSGVSTLHGRVSGTIFKSPTP